jgi:anti-anti-sigma factor
MPVQITHKNGIAVLTVLGRLDSHTASELETAAFDALATAYALVVDLTGTSDPSSQALRTLTVLDTVMMHRGQRLCICPEVSLLRRGLDAAGVALRASYVPSVDAAEALLSPAE